ncbi:MAG: hypothetical protein WB347_22925 [Terriglobales bacterium]
MDSLKGYPRGLPLPRPEEIPKMQADVIEQLGKRLKELRTKERILNEPVDSIAIEYQLQRLAEKAGVRNACDITHGLAIVFDEFGPQHRKTLYQVLNSIEENIRWRGVHWSRYMVKD